MITDMKSFSKMTEEEGSIVSAKTIQRHRDLLIPVITAHEGHGKSTGGDGLVAAFATATDAPQLPPSHADASCVIYNDEHESERDIIIRCGIASGEVVLDKGGRPFIGAALNLAARIMNLGDGGQILTTRPVVDKAGASPGYSSSRPRTLHAQEHRGAHEVVEILWAADQQPLEPQGVRADADVADA